MVTTTVVPTYKTIEVPGDIYPIQYSKRLVKTGTDFYDMLKLAAKMGVRPSTAGEEQVIYAQRSAGAKKLRYIDELKDYFGENDGGWHAWAHTLTGLRFREADLRKEYNVGDKITALVIETDITPYISQIADPKFTRENWNDIIENVNHVKGEVLVPYVRGQVIDEMDPVLGIWKKIREMNEHKEPYALHAWLRENLSIPKDPISEHYDVAVERGCDWRLGGDGCLGVRADYGRSGAGSNDGFRPMVRGSVSEGPKIEVPYQQLFELTSKQSN